MCGSWFDSSSRFIDLSCSFPMCRFLDPLVHSVAFSVGHLGAVPVYDVVEIQDSAVFVCIP